MKSNWKFPTVGFLAIVLVPALLAAIGYTGDWAGSAAVGRLAEFRTEYLPIPLLMFHGLFYAVIVAGFSFLAWRIGKAILGAPKEQTESAKIIRLRK